jgi:hypothetical protein
VKLTAVLMAVFLVACGGGGGSDSASYETVEEIADVLGCDPEPTEETGFGTAPQESGTCTVDGDPVDIAIYETSDHLEQSLREASGIGCAMAVEFGIEEFSFARGDNWVVSPDDNLDTGLAEDLASQLDGEAQTVEC